MLFLYKTTKNNITVKLQVICASKKTYCKKKKFTFPSAGLEIMLFHVLAELNNQSFSG